MRGWGCALDYAAYDSTLSAWGRKQHQHALMAVHAHAVGRPGQPLLVL